MHEHDFTELVIVISGECMHTTSNGDSYHVSEGNIFVLPPGLGHSYTSVSDFSLVNILYNPDLLPQLDIGNLPGYQTLFMLEPNLPFIKKHLRLSSLILENIKAQINNLEMLLSNARLGYRFHSLSIFMNIVYELSEFFSFSSQQEHPKDLFKLGQLLSFINYNYRRPLRVKYLAQRMSISEMSLYRLFSCNLGTSPMGYINNLRISHAQKFLLNTNNSIAQIAEDVGIPDSNYFSRCFRKSTGVSPREFRNQKQQDTPGATKK
ncbi:MAG: helix-turn-helix domain-containing protein [Victivallales bacterium]|nr:helix-turn-helix domain-containing protein [Victivallales bacterium]